MHRGTVRVETGSPDQARALAAALGPDSEGFLEVEVDGSVVALTAEAETVAGLRRTLDDALAGVQAARVEPGEPDG